MLYLSPVLVEFSQLAVAQIAADITEQLRLTQAPAIEQLPEKTT
jgi:hypothetical protein